MEKSLVLIIDDEEQMRKILRYCFGEKYNIIEARCGNEGIEKFKMHNPEVVITDYKMPGKSE